jgi:hypothetical protein
MKACFGWEWIVEAWLFREATEGNLSTSLRTTLFPDGSAEPRNPTRGQEKAGPPARPGTLRVAEVPNQADQEDMP